MAEKINFRKNISLNFYTDPDIKNINNNNNKKNKHKNKS